MKKDRVRMNNYRLIINKKNIFSVLVSFFMGMLILQACSGTPHSYYVSQSGDDKNPGTREKPFRSLQKINTLLLKPGDRICLKGGEVFDGPLLLTVHGEMDNPVIITNDGDNNATVNGGNKEAIIIRGSYFRLTNINTKGAGRKTGNTTNGIRLIEASQGVVENIKAEGFQKSGIEIDGCNHIDIKNVQGKNNGYCGINITGTREKRSKNILVKDCTAENNSGDPTNLDNHSGNGILVGLSDSVVIDHCTATNNGWDMPRVGNGPVGIWAYESDHVTIQYCISYRNKTSKGGKDGGGFDLDGGTTNSVIQYCLSYENEGAGYGLFQYAGASLWYNNIVRYCISINDAVTTVGSGGIFVWNSSPDSVQLADCIIHNNLVYSTHAPAIQFEANSLNKNFSFYNNIFIGSGPIIHGPSSGEKFTGNIWWNDLHEIKFREYKTLSEWARATGQEMLDGKIAGKHVDPLLTGPLVTSCTDPYKLNSLTGYTLSSSSPLKNTGLNLSALFKIPVPPYDFFGNPVPQGNNPEPGVHEIKE